MHNRAGAVTETEFVFADAIRTAFESDEPLRFATVGLGVGYIDLWLAAQSIREKRAISVRSFESNSELRNDFVAWLAGKSTNEILKNAFDGALWAVAKRCDVAPSLIQKRILEMKNEGSWIFDEALNVRTDWNQRVGAILYDAFSATSNPDLWSAEFFDELFLKATSPRCVFATYASLGVLKRALIAHGFKLIPKKGYAGKRESTLAARL